MVCISQKLQSNEMDGATSKAAGFEATMMVPLVQNEESDDELKSTAQEEDASYLPARKRAKRTQGQRGGAIRPVKRPRRRGRLEMLPELNLDVLFLA